VAIVGESGDSDEERVFATVVLADSSCYLTSIHLGHRKVEQHYIGLARTGFLDGVVPSVRPDDFVPCQLQKHGERVGGVVVVVNDNDAAKTVQWHDRGYSVGDHLIASTVLPVSEPPLLYADSCQEEDRSSGMKLP